MMVSPGKDLLESYDHLLERSKELTVLQSAGSIVYWDMETKMPPRGVQLRSQQLALLEKIGHRMLTDPENGKLIDTIKGHGDYETLDDVQKRNVYLAKKYYDEATKLPEELVVETARQSAVTINIWKKAKAAKDWEMFKPDLEKLFELRVKAADILMDVKGVDSRYNALIDVYEPGMTQETIAKVFSGMKDGLVEIIDKVQDAPKKPKTEFLERKIPIEAQEEIAVALSEIIGYDVLSGKAGGRIDETEHPFTTGYYDDVRITTHYYEEKFTSSIFSVLHEGGHALYEQGLPREWMYQPIGSSSSNGIHESQSRFVENMFGRSPEFWGYFHPRLGDLVGDTLSDVDLNQFVLAINKVEPSKIRVEADEVTYGLHIIIRFELERDLMADKISIDELPQVWNEKYRDYLGVEVEHDSEGVMQDTHWAGGSYGYFPSYALGNIYGGQMLEKMAEDIPIYKEKVAQGCFKEMGSWLVENVHKYGNLYDPADLIKLITGDELRIEPFLNYLDDKYSKLYGY
jgi:carboxypeptidase Taq